MFDITGVIMNTIQNHKSEGGMTVVKICMEKVEALSYCSAEFGSKSKNISFVGAQ